MHLLHLQEVLTLIDAYQLMINRKKCSFGRDQLEYLGHIISKSKENSSYKEMANTIGFERVTRVSLSYRILSEVHARGWKYCATLD